MTAYARRDAAHGPIKKALLAAGVPLIDTARHHGLGFDLLGLHVKNRTVEAVEVKNPGWRPSDLTDSEKAAMDRLGAHWHVAATPEEALRIFGVL